jgi:hypothetical protein
MSLALDNILVDDEALSFAEETGLKESLDEVVKFTSAAFPSTALHFALDIDPENASDRQITVYMDATGWSSGQMLSAHNAWFAKLVASALGPLQRSFFRLHLRESA